MENLTTSKLLEYAATVAKPYCGSYKITHLLSDLSGQIYAIGSGFDGGFRTHAFCWTHMDGEGNYYWSHYGFFSQVDCVESLFRQCAAIVHKVEVKDVQRV